MNSLNHQTNMPDDNPFAVSESVANDAQAGNSSTETISKDGQYIVYRRSILFRGDLELPQICLVTGASQDLVRRDTHHIDFFASKIFVLILTVIFLLIGSLFHGLPTGWLLLGLLFIGGQLFSHFPPKRLRNSYRTTWYISKSNARFHNWLTQIVRVLLTVAITLIAWISGDTLEQSIWFAVVTFVITALLSLTMKTETRLSVQGKTLIGRHRGCRVATGHTRAFYESFQIQRSFDEHD